MASFAPTHLCGSYERLGQSLACLFSTMVYATAVEPVPGEGNVTLLTFPGPILSGNLSLHLQEDQQAGQLINTWSLDFLASPANASEPQWFTRVYNATSLGHKRILNVVLRAGASPVGDGFVFLPSQQLVAGSASASDTPPPPVALHAIRFVVEGRFPAPADAPEAVPQLRAARLFDWDPTSACVV